MNVGKKKAMTQKEIELNHDVSLDINSNVIIKRILEWEASIVGFGNMEGLLPDELNSLKTGISIAIRLSDQIIEQIRNGPTQTYAHHYQTINQCLDSVAVKVTNLLQGLNYHAIPIPASQIIDKEKLEGLISHKMVATRAGMGWIGKSALLITPQYGPRVRLVSILTDAPLEISQQINSSECGKCLSCVKACPSQAIKGENWVVGMEREELLDVERCNKVTEENKVAVGEQICGICINRCPIGRM